MVLSEGTVNVLKNFAQINPSILFKQGNELSTMSTQKTILCTATVDETFPVKGAIYDLNRFLGVLTLFDNPELSFDEKRITIKQEGRSIAYTFADERMIVAPPERKIDFPEPDITVELQWKEIQNVLRAASVMGLPEIALVGSDGKVSICATDSANPTIDNYSSTLGDAEGNFKFVFKVENLKLINYNYQVQVTAKGIAKFTSTNQFGPKVVYYIATEASSSYSKE